VTPASVGESHRELGRERDQIWSDLKREKPREAAVAEPTIGDGRTTSSSGISYPYM
jgi:hypothetical protein